MDITYLSLIAGLVLTISLVIALGISRIGLPSLVAFLILGMLIGTDGIIGLEFNNAQLSQLIGSIGLVVILFEGGMSTSWRRLKDVTLSAASLSTVGVLITALLTSISAYWIFDLPLLYAALIGAVVSSTDAAAVFASMRTSTIKRRLARTIEAESGINDPMAIALTLGLISWVSIAGYGFDNIAVLLAKQLGIGLLAGLILGYVATKLFSKLPQTIGVFAPVASLAVCALSFGLTQLAGGSGFLAVYLVGLAIGSTPSRYRSQLTSFHEGLAFLAQVVMFITLGLLVNPRDLVSIIGPGIILAILLVLVLRPVAVWVSLLFSKFTHKEKLFIGFAGLRGAVPIVLGTFVLSSGIEYASTIFNIVFFVVLISALLQGSLVEKFAIYLGLIDEIDNSTNSNYDPKARSFTKFIVAGNHAIVGAQIHEIGLPIGCRVVSIKRKEVKITPTLKTVIEVGDEIKISFPGNLQPEVEDTTIRWRRRI